MKIKVSNVNTPNWKDVNVKSHVPAELEKLSELAHNIWWSWNYEATELFKDLDPALWKEVGHNPVLLLERMSYAKLEALANDKVILKRMNDVYAMFRTYMDVKPDQKRPSVAYFSMEYGLNQVLKIYSGGLGVLFWNTCLTESSPIFGDRFVICDTGLYELVPAFILSIIVIVVVSLIDKKPSQQVYDEFNRVCTEKFD